MAETDGFTHMPDEPDLITMVGQVWACDICGQRMIYIPGNQHDEFPAHQLEHDQPDPEPENPFDQFATKEELEAYLAQTAITNIPAEIRQLLVDRCNELGVDLSTYKGWIEGHRLA